MQDMQIFFLLILDLTTFTKSNIPTIKLSNSILIESP